MMLSRELTDSEWAEGTSPWRTTTARIRTRGKRALITTNYRRRSDRLPPSSARANPLLARTTTIRSHRPRCTEARLSRRSGRIHAPRLTTCISAKVSLSLNAVAISNQNRLADFFFFFSSRISCRNFLYEWMTFFFLTATLTANRWDSVYIATWPYSSMLPIVIFPILNNSNLRSLPTYFPFNSFFLSIFQFCFLTASLSLISHFYLILSLLLIFLFSPILFLFCPKLEQCSFPLFPPSNSSF